MFAIPRCQFSDLGPRKAKEGERPRVGDYRRFLEEALSLKQLLADAISTAGEGPFDERTIWGLYARTEKLISTLKFKVGYETPGTFAKLPTTNEPKALMEHAEMLLSQSAEEISRQKPKDAVKSLRNARNDLRAYLTERRKSALRAERQARKRKPLRPS
jgi:hypothetical protein